MKEGGGGGEGRKRLQTNPLILKTKKRTQRLIGSATESNNIEMCRSKVKGLFQTERSCMVCDTHLPAVVVYSGRQDLPENARAFSLTSFGTQSSSCNYLSFRLFSLFSKVSPGSE